MSPALADKRAGSCRTGPCRMPRRCWAYVTCFLYGEGTTKIEIPSDRQLDTASENSPGGERTREGRSGARAWATAAFGRLMLGNVYYRA